MPSQKGFALPVLLAILLGLIVIGGSTYLVIHKNGASQQDAGTVVQKDSSDISTLCDTQDCFNNLDVKFTHCEPSTFDTQYFSNGSMTGTQQIAIIGLESKYCKVMVRQLQGSSNPGWIGKTMTCLLENTKPFATAMTDTHRCSGDLYDLLVPKSIRPPAAFACDLTTHTLDVHTNVPVALNVVNYVGQENEVTWSSENPNIAIASPAIGSSVRIEPKSVGQTNLVVTDNAAGPDCHITIPITITAIASQQPQQKCGQNPGSELSDLRDKYVEAQRIYQYDLQNHVDPSTTEAARVAFEAERTAYFALISKCSSK